MKYAPHDYQTYATRYIEEHPISAVLLDMGLGKTSITLTALNDLLFDSFEAHRILVIGPLRVARDTWTAEADKWDHLQSLICSVAVGTETERRSALIKPADIYIINRENVQWLIEDSRLPFNYDTVVVDELSSVSLVLKGDSDYTGTINTANTAKVAKVTLGDGCTWTLTGNAYLTSFSGRVSGIVTNGFTVYVNGQVLAG